MVTESAFLRAGVILMPLANGDRTRRQPGGREMHGGSHGPIRRIVAVARALAPLWKDLGRLSLRLALAALRPTRVADPLTES
jgi:hypothetical protein